MRPEDRNAVPAAPGTVVTHEQVTIGQLIACVKELLSCADPHRDRKEIKRANDLLKKLEN